MLKKEFYHAALFCYIQYMIHTTAGIAIGADPWRLIALYTNYDTWHKLFPQTIRGTRLIEENNGVTIVEVDHRTEGHVINMLTPVSNREVRLEEIKPHYHAVFINRFQPNEEGTLFTVEAFVKLKGYHKLTSPLVERYIKTRIRKYMLEPMLQYASRFNLQY
jgi:hypothetical protein